MTHLPGWYRLIRCPYPHEARPPPHLSGSWPELPSRLQTKARNKLNINHFIIHVHPENIIVKESLMSDGFFSWTINKINFPNDRWILTDTSNSFGLRKRV